MFWSKKLANEPTKADPSIRRSHLSPDELVSVPLGGEVRVVGDIFPYCAKKYGSKTAAYTRDVVDIVTETKMVPKRGGEGTEEKKWQYFTLSPPKPVTFQALADTVSHLTSGLVEMGFTNTAITISDRPRVSIYADTSLRWQLMAQAFCRLGHTITTAYTTLGQEGLEMSWKEPDVELCFAGEGQLGMVAKALGQVERMKWIIYDGSEQRIDQDAKRKITEIVTARGGQILHVSELEALGKSNPRSEEALGPKPTPDDLFCIMYTSGSTGPPKGVLLSHGNMIASIAGSTTLYQGTFSPKSDMLLAFLPLTHILEQFLEMTFYILGVPVAYATPKTLLDDSVRNCQGDFSAYKPTLMGGVPAIFEMIRKGMMKKLSEAGPVVGAVFNTAVKGKQTLPWPFNAMIDRVLFARVKAATGGRLRMAVCGGGALSKTTQLFLSTVLVSIQQGYGLTETCGMTAITTPEYWQLGNVGVLGPSTECRLNDEPELGYTNSNDPPQGEVWLRGPNVFKGYFKRDELTKESFTEDGWFKTGDIGQWEANGTLSIIDRIKNLIKLQNGEYLALDKVESMYKTTDVIMMLCIAAPPEADQPIAVVYPHEGNLRLYLKAAGLPDTGDPESWSEDPKVKALILDELLKTAKKQGLTKAETIRDVVLTTEEWSPDNGLLTPAMKMNRPAISKRYAAAIEAVYGRK